MNITFQHRAEIAERYLEKKEKQQVEKAIDLFANKNFNELSEYNLLSKLHSIIPTDNPLFSYVINNRLRMIISINQNNCVIEDIVSYKN
jgi:hypothetical protein